MKADKYAKLREIAGFGAEFGIDSRVFVMRSDLRALLADYDEAERALVLSGKMCKGLMEQHMRDSKTLMKYARARDEASARALHSDAVTQAAMERVAKMEVALYTALSFVENAETDVAYKPGAVRAALKQIRAALGQEES